LGEFQMLREAVFTTQALLATAYLIVFGSLIVFPTYQWLIRVSTPAKVSTHAYVNPVIAVILGWALADEAISLRMLFAGAIIIASVIAINLDRGPVPRTARSTTLGLKRV